MRSIVLTILAVFSITHVFADIEDNDTYQTANALDQDTSVKGVQSDVDWYVINVTTGNRILVDLTFTHDDGNIDLGLYDEVGNADPNFPGTPRGLSLTDDSDHEFIDANVPPGAGTYYIRVFGGSGGNTGNSYTLTWTEMGTDDGFEPNNDISNSAALTESTVAFGSQSDEDWYSITAAADGTRLLVSLRFNVADNLELALHDNDGNEIVPPSGNGAGVNESIDFTVTTLGTYHLRVTDNNSAKGYAIDWEGIVPDAVTPDTTPPPSGGGGSSGSVSLFWLLAAMLVGVARRMRS